MLFQGFHQGGHIGFFQQALGSFSNSVLLHLLFWKFAVDFFNHFNIKYHYLSFINVFRVCNLQILHLFIVVNCKRTIRKQKFLLLLTTRIILECSFYCIFDLVINEFDEVFLVHSEMRMTKIVDI